MYSLCSYVRDSLSFSACVKARFTQVNEQSLSTYSLDSLYFTLYRQRTQCTETHYYVTPEGHRCGIRSVSIVSAFILFFIESQVILLDNYLLRYYFEIRVTFLPLHPPQMKCIPFDIVFLDIFFAPGIFWFALHRKKRVNGSQLFMLKKQKQIWRQRWQSNRKKNKWNVKQTLRAVVPNIRLSLSLLGDTDVAKWISKWFFYQLGFMSKKSNCTPVRSSPRERKSTTDEERDSGSRRKGRESGVNKRN